MMSNGDYLANNLEYKSLSKASAVSEAANCQLLLEASHGVFL